jgi:hypothetical protein
MVLGFKALHASAGLTFCTLKQSRESERDDYLKIPFENCRQCGIMALFGIAN